VATAVAALLVGSPLRAAQTRNVCARNAEGCAAGRWPLPNHQIAHVLGTNLLQAGTAVGANFTAAMEMDNLSNKAAQHQTCEQRPAVTAYWLRILGQTGMVASPEIDPLPAETDELTAIFTAGVKVFHRVDEE